MAKFEVGEIAIYQNLVGRGQYWNGEECEVIKPLGKYLSNIEPDELVYYVKDGQGIFSVREDQIRKKKPPKEELSTWEEIQKLTNWNPEKVKA